MTDNFAMAVSVVRDKQVIAHQTVSLPSLKGRPMWVGCKSSVPVPRHVIDLWRLDFASSDLPAAWERPPGALFDTFVFRRGDTVIAKLLNGSTIVDRGSVVVQGGEFLQGTFKEIYLKSLNEWNVVAVANRASAPPNRLVFTIEEKNEAMHLRLSFVSENGSINPPLMTEWRRPGDSTPYPAQAVASEVLADLFIAAFIDGQFPTVIERLSFIPLAHSRWQPSDGMQIALPLPAAERNACLRRARRARSAGVEEPASGPCAAFLQRGRSGAPGRQP